MRANHSETTKESTSDADRFAELWNALSRNQQRFAVAMLEFPTKKAAALAVGLEPDTVYRWPDEVDEVVQYLVDSAVLSAFEILASSVVKAAAVKRSGLDSDDEKVRQMVSSEVLDRILGAAVKRLEHTGAGGTDIVFRVGNIDLEDDL